MSVTISPKQIFILRCDIPVGWFVVCLVAVKRAAGIQDRRSIIARHEYLQHIRLTYRLRYLDLSPSEVKSYRASAPLRHVVDCAAGWTARDYALSRIWEDRAPLLEHVAFNRFHSRQP